MEQSPKNIGTLEIWAQRLRGRSRMALASIGGLFLVGFFLVARPLGQRIDEANDRLDKAEARMQLAEDIGNLRHQSSLYQKKLPCGVDLNDWTQYLLAGIRSQPVRLTRMDPKDQLALGPCKVLSWNVEMEGDFASVAKVVEGLENGERLVRLDRLIIQSVKGRLTMSMVVRGLALDAPIPKDKEKSPASGGASAMPVAAESHAKK